MALWECAKRAPDADIGALSAYAWKRARGAIIDALRIANGGRRNALTHGGYGFAHELVFAARTTGDLPDVVRSWKNVPFGGGLECGLDLVSPIPSPEEQLIARSERHARLAELPAKLARLSNRDRIIVCLALLGIRPSEIARLLRLTQARVSQITTGFAGTKPVRKRRPVRRKKKLI